MVAGGEEAKAVVEERVVEEVQMKEVAADEEVVQKLGTGRMHDTRVMSEADMI